MSPLEFKEAVFLDQSAQALQLTLLRDLDAGQFLVLARGEHRFGAIWVEAAIIGASHTIRYSYENFQLWEVFASTPVEGSRIEVFGAGNSQQSRAQHPLGDFVYEFESKSLPWRQGCEGAESLQRAVEAEGAGEIGLSYTFPRGPFEHAPRTIVRVREQQQTVCVQTVHSYPNEERIVFTQSKVSPRGVL